MQLDANVMGLFGRFFGAYILEHSAADVSGMLRFCELPENFRGCDFEISPCFNWLHLKMIAMICFLHLGTAELRSFEDTCPLTRGLTTLEDVEVLNSDGARDFLVRIFPFSRQFLSSILSLLGLIVSPRMSIPVHVECKCDGCLVQFWGYPFLNLVGIWCCFREL